MVLHGRRSALSQRDAHRPHPSITSMAMATALQPHGHGQRSSISGASACTPNFFCQRVQCLLLAPRLGSAWSASGRVRGVGGVA
jgi:hypothetical protein